VIYYCCHLCDNRWHGGAIGRTLYLWCTCHRFESWLGTIAYWSWAS